MDRDYICLSKSSSEASTDPCRGNSDIQDSVQDAYAGQWIPEVLTSAPMLTGVMADLLRFRCVSVERDEASAMPPAGRGFASPPLSSRAPDGLPF